MAVNTTHLVNLDALIVREDFENDGVAALGSEPLFKVEELAKGKLYFSVLRKPEFQRETASWDSQMILDFIESFLDDKLIPSIIIWHSKQTGKVFIVDGAHRVSALIAWVNDDYGNGQISQAFYGPGIQEREKKLHRDTKNLIDSRVGTFVELLHIGLNPDSTTDSVKLRRGRAIATRQPHIQKVDGSAAVAEESFFKINANPATIDQTELDTIRARKKPNAIATRALLRAGSGYKHWDRFGERGKEIEDTAREVHNLVFGAFSDIGSKSPDVPRAGQPYSAEAFRMVLDMVNLFNKISPGSWQHTVRERVKGKLPLSLPDDEDGSITLQFLKKIKTVGMLVHSNEYSGSLGLDQAVYSYGTTGKIHSAAFLASLKLAMDLRDNDKMHAFTEVRAAFEDFLVAHQWFLNNLGHAKGSRNRALESSIILHRTVIECLQNGTTNHLDIIAELAKKPELKSLKPQLPGDDDKPTPRKFSKTVQAAAIVREVLETRPRCPICKARLPPYARSKDHKTRQENGGRGELENLQFTHPFCQSGYKERLHAAEQKTHNSSSMSE
jgi:hypothetical protein